MNHYLDWIWKGNNFFCKFCFLCIFVISSCLPKKCLISIIFSQLSSLIILNVNTYTVDKWQNYSTIHGLLLYVIFIQFTRKSSNIFAGTKKSLFKKNHWNLRDYLRNFVLFHNAEFRSEVVRKIYPLNRQWYTPRLK